MRNDAQLRQVFNETFDALPTAGGAAIIHQQFNTAVLKHSANLEVS
jgi:hypothetical protein